jgi:predicted site-specific integrase-resolvase
MRVAIYARVSTDDKGQDPENQLRELRDWVINSGHIISREYVDYESGRKGAEKRKQFAALFDDAAERKCDCVILWALDRSSREGMAQTIIHLQRLSSYGVAFHSYTDPHLATDNELVRNILLALLSSLAKVEAQKRGMCEGWSLEIGMAFRGSVVRRDLGREQTTWIASINSTGLGEFLEREIAMRRVEELVESSMGLVLHDWDLYQAAKGKR